MGAVVLLLFIFFGVKAVQGTNNDQPDRPSVEESLNNIGNEDVASLDEEDEYDEDEFTREGDTSGYVADNSTPEEMSKTDKASPETRDASTTAAANEKKSTTSVPTNYDANASKPYLVVGGSFRKMVNAEAALKQMKSQGYRNAEIGRFNNSSLAALIIDRYPTYFEAKNYVNELKKKGIEAYVHKKR